MRFAHSFAIRFMFMVAATGFSGCVKNYFQGTISYRYRYLNADGADITQSMKGKEDLEQHYSVNRANYKSVNERGQLVQLYNASTNQYYLKVGMELQKIDASIEYPRDFEPTRESKKVRILGKSCSSLLVTTEVATTTYFFSRKYKVDPAKYVNHRFGNWYGYLRWSKGALPLKFVVRTKDLTVEAVAYEIRPRPLENDEFDVKQPGVWR